MIFMTNETLEKGNEIRSKIRNVQNVISSFTYRKFNARQPDPFRPWQWKLLLCNKDDNKTKLNNTRAAIVVFDNISSYGSEIRLEEEDSELLDIIIGYYNNKLKKLEEELASL